MNILEEKVYKNQMDFRWHYAIFKGLQFKNDRPEYPTKQRKQKGKLVKDEMGKMKMDFIYKPLTKFQDEFEEYIKDRYNSYLTGTVKEIENPSDMGSVQAVNCYFTHFEIPDYNIVGFAVLNYYGLVIEGICLKKYSEDEFEVCLPHIKTTDENGKQININWVDFDDQEADNVKYFLIMKYQEALLKEAASN